MAGASLGGMSGMHLQGGLPIPGIVHIEQPYYADHGEGMTRGGIRHLRASWLEERSRNWGRTRSPPSSANRFRARAA
jgi:putrescine aminotransferase